MIPRYEEERKRKKTSTRKRTQSYKYNLAAYQRQGLDAVVFETAVAQVQRRARRRRWVRVPRLERVRSAVQALIDRGPTGKEHHHENLVILFELINAGYSHAEIHAVFQRIFGERYDATT